jgi:hypothetical protein
MATSKNPKLNQSDLELFLLNLAPSSLLIVPFFQAATLISPMINLLTIFMKKIAIIIAAMIFNAPILSSLGRMAFKSSLCCTYRCRWNIPRFSELKMSDHQV